MSPRARAPRPPDESSAAPSEDSAAPSKSQRKRDMLALQKLGESLLPLADERLARLPISPALLDAVRMARTIRAHEGRRRQLQYIGRLMRDVDAQALADALADETREDRAATALLHAAERWRERILADDAALAQWLERHPDTRDSVEPLVARARAELAGAGAGRAFRELFRRLRAQLGG